MDALFNGSSWRLRHQQFSGARGWSQNWVPEQCSEGVVQACTGEAQRQEPSYDTHQNNDDETTRCGDSAQASAPSPCRTSPPLAEKDLSLTTRPDAESGAHGAHLFLWLQGLRTPETDHSQCRAAVPGPTPCPDRPAARLTVAEPARGCWQVGKNKFGCKALLVVLQVRSRQRTSRPPPLPRTPGSGTPGGVALRGHACPRASRVVELDACAEPPHRRARDAGGAAAVREPVLRAAAEPIRFPWMGARAQPGEHAAPSALRPNPVPNASHCATPRTCGLTSTRLGFWEGGAVPHRRCTPCRWRDEGSARGPRLLRPTAGAAVLRFAFCSLFLIICPLSGVPELTPGTGSDAHRGGRRARRWRPGACEPRLQLQRRRRASHALRGRAGRPRSNGPAPRRHPGPGTARLSHDK